MANVQASSEMSAADASTGSKTIADLLPLAARKHGSKQAVLYNDGTAWVGKSFTEVGEIVRDLSLGLVALGIEKGEKVAILANTRVEWSYFDFAVLSAGATVVPIYQSNSPEECQYILENSDARAVVVEDASQLEKVLKVKDQCPKLEFVITMTGEGDSQALSMADLAAKGREAGLGEADWEARWSSVTSDDICTFIYTSGTTGPPKGCVISHGNYRSMLGMIHSVNTLGTDELTYLYLPLAHSFALLIQLGSFDLGATLAYWQCDATKIMPDLAEVKPTYFPSVPRVFEKIYTTATSDIAKEGGAKEKIFNWAISVGEQVRAKEHAGQSVSPVLKFKHGIADKLVLSKIRSLFGGNLKLAVSGAAPINPDILRFFDASGVLVLEGWGMTETSTAATVATPDAFKFGTIGKPFPGCEIKIADDGEILVKGPNVFQGYYKNDEATSETLVDGWLHTGDVGEIDAEGYIKITGRKKDIIITAGGKNITPANLEAEIKQSPWVSQCVVIGDRRPYLIALVTLDIEECEKLAADKGWPTDSAELSKNPEMKQLIETHVEEINQKFAQVEQIKKISILPADLTQEGGELTPTLKVKRNVVADKYADVVDSVYAG